MNSLQIGDVPKDALKCRLCRLTRFWNRAFLCVYVYIHIQYMCVCEFDLLPQLVSGQV